MISLLSKYIVGNFCSPQVELVTNFGIVREKPNLLLVYKLSLASFSVRVDLVEVVVGTRVGFILLSVGIWVGELARSGETVFD